MAYTLILILILYLIVGFFLQTIYHMQVPVLPDGAWALLSVFAGTYTMSRGAEKFSTNWNYTRYSNDGGNATPDDNFDDVTEVN